MEDPFWVELKGSSPDPHPEKEREKEKKQKKTLQSKSQKTRKTFVVSRQQHIHLKNAWTQTLICDFLKSTEA